MWVFIETFTQTVDKHRNENKICCAFKRGKGKKSLLIGDGERKEDVERERENRVTGEGDGILSLVMEAINRALSFINGEAEWVGREDGTHS